ncbi:glycerophosphodiester phosphodiesterase family protein [Pseudoroseomonas cervicalis]|uniref:glycerophosphodiester phosphodiesterase n=1 Tax=Teichococcus cervicalis TaxID=204525 RepID=UPI0027844A62|nr:glycerophosphodiester phosphodiesterase family protein [Pseudoroseomonas cervicalis]MDQ1079400.1 glycerophosphoryl diester phosphodiesterase [Pseudoroseomonas cervicalis]
MQTPPTQIVSHRGGAFLWPENSLEAFRNSLALPIEQAECDIHLSADGVPVVIHDTTLQRTTEGQGPVSSRGAAELAQLRLRGAGHLKIPLLSELAALFRGQAMQLQVELKTPPGQAPDPALLRRTLSVLDEAGIRAQCRIISFEADLAAAAQRAGGLAGVIWLFEPGLLASIGAEGVVGVARAHGFDTVETHIAALDEALAQRLRQAGLRIGVWGANHAPGIGRALSLGVDMMATDDPVLALALRG